MVDREEKPAADALSEADGGETGGEGPTSPDSEAAATTVEPSVADVEPEVQALECDSGAKQPEAGEAPAAAAQEEGCPVEMLGGPCGRAIYQAPASVDEKPVCLMHSRDPNKSEAEFQRCFEEMLEAAGEGVADFSGFVFRSSNYPGWRFAALCVFKRATFTQDAHFTEATFTQDANFEGATFTHAASFLTATFARDANFEDATFTWAAIFGLATFARDAEFSFATFTQAADFKSATFAQAAHFSAATFARDADFWGATFTQAASFSRATFTRDADFEDATFAQAAHFSAATFAQAAHFSAATFTQAANFRSATFAQVADFRGTKFLDRAEFRGTKFREDGNALPGPIFDGARFEKPERVTFYQCFLGQALFHNCDVSRFTFSDVRWAPPGGRIRLLEEIVSLGQQYASSLRPSGEGTDKRNYRIIAETYHQLKNNYDAKGDPWTAGEFHFGELEILRQTSAFKHPWARWLHRKLGLTALYKYASHYGLSLRRPVIGLVVVLLVFMFVYPLVGLRPAPGKGPGVAPAGQAASAPASLTYRNYPKEPFGLPKLWGHSLMTALGVASLQKDLAYYEPNHGPGRALALAELVFTSTLLALFLLSVRRRFKR